MDKPQLGRLPRPADKAVLAIAALAPAKELPAPPLEIHNIELVPDPDMLGNDVWGDCVFVSIENNRRIAAAALGVAITRLTAAQVIAKYKTFTGVTVAPGPGAIIVDALNWVRKDPAGWGGNHLLFFGDVAHSELAIRQGVNEFQSAITGENIRAAQEWPAKIWDHTRTAVLGGHATAGGTFTQLYDFLKTWGYMVEVTPAFFSADIDEVLVCVWDFQWETLSYDRQTSLIADVQQLTGKAWTGPAPIPPIVPIQRIAMTRTGMKAVRFADCRPGQVTLLPVGQLKPGLNVVQITGYAGIPANATEITGKIEIINPPAVGWVNIGPDSLRPTTSTVWFPVGGGAHPMSFTSLLSPDGKIYIWNGSLMALDWDLDITGFFS